MFVYLLSTCPAANGVRRIPTTYATPDSSHLQNLDDFHTQWQSVATRGVKLTSIYCALDTCKIGCHSEVIPSHLDSSSFLILLGPYSMENRTGDLNLTPNQMPPHACCRQATWPLWPPISSACSRMGSDPSCSLLLGLAFSEWVHFPRKRVYLESEWGWIPLYAHGIPESLQCHWYVLFTTSSPRMFSKCNSC